MGTRSYSLRLQLYSHVTSSFQLRKELANFGPEFFDEIEDLKFNYREAVQKNVQYEEKLNHFSKQFGVTLDV